MKVSILRLLLAAVLLMAVTGVVQAGPISGSLALSGNGDAMNGANLLVSTVVSDTYENVSNYGIGDFADVPYFPPPPAYFSGFTLNLPTIYTGGGFTIHSLDTPSWGSFTASTGVILVQDAHNLDVYLLGTYTPGPAFLALDPTLLPDATSFYLSLNQTGGSVSGGGTLSSPPAGYGTPEPGTWYLLSSAGLGLLGYGRFRRRA